MCGALQVVAVAAGREHAVVSTSDGKVFTWGGRDLLAGRKGNMKEPGQALVRGRADWARWCRAMRRELAGTAFGHLRRALAERRASRQPALSAVRPMLPHITGGSRRRLWQPACPLHPGTHLHGMLMHCQCAQGACMHACMHK